jgi:phosphoglycerate dehydrogenase-like enzyme
LALIRSIPFSDGQMKNGLWQRRKGLELYERTLGLIGCGRIGQMVSQLALAFGMNVLAFDAFPDQNFAPSSRFQFTTLESVFIGSDIISFHCPEQADGCAILDRNSIRKLKPGVFLVNTARASLIDEAGVMEGIDGGRIAGFALDVYDREPPDTGPLLAHDCVIATPHIGGYTAESVSRATLTAVENLLEYFKGSK